MGVERALLLAMASLAKDKPEEAVQTLEPMWQKYPTLPQLAGWYAWALFQKDPEEQYDYALNLLKRANQEDPSEPQFFYFLGELHASKDHWTPAEIFYLRAVRLQKNHMKAQDGLKKAREKLQVIRDSI